MVTSISFDPLSRRLTGTETSDHPDTAVITGARVPSHGQDGHLIRICAARATQSRNWAEAERCWGLLYLRDRDDREALLGLIAAMQGLGRIEAAELMFANAASHHAAHADYAMSFALNAQLRFDLDDAIARSLIIVERFPGLSHGYGFAAMLLTAADRHDEGGEILAKGRERFPDESSLMLPSIHLSVARHDWQMAAAELDRLNKTFPAGHAVRMQAEKFEVPIATGYADLLRQRASDAETKRDFETALKAWQTHSSVAGPGRDNLLGIGRSSRELGAFDQAERAFAEAAAKVGSDAEIEANLAQVPAAAGDWSEAARRWRAVVERFPDMTALVTMAAPAIASAGDVDAADDMIRSALDRDPRSIGLWATYAVVAQIAGRWDTAVERWGAVIVRAPDDPGFRVLRDEARARLDAARRTVALVEQPIRSRREILLDEDVELPPMTQIVKQFESIGDNCEFGVVQRHFGAEPITLFRFAAIEPEKMIELLEQDLEPLGDPAHTHVYEMMDEYYIKDDRGYYYMHTFVKIKQVDPERYVKQQVPRIAYLKRNFLTDIKTGEKIYVCKHSTSQISDDTLSRLSRCLRKHGDNILLGGRRADEHHPAGSVERLDANVFVGYTTQLHGEEDRSTNSQSWGIVLRKVYQEIQRQSDRAIIETA